MAKVIITKALKEEMFRKFGALAENLFLKMKSLEQQPQRGKAIGNVDGIVIKELKEGKFRFYCVTEGHRLKFGTEDELASLLIKFVKMSDKKDQQKAIDSVKHLLQTLGFDAF